MNETDVTHPGTPRAKSRRSPKDWQCQECGHRMTLRQAEKASFGPDGCPKCGGADIDLAAEVS